MNDLYWPYNLLILTCEIFGSITIKHIDRAFLQPPRIILHTQRSQFTILTRDNGNCTAVIRMERTDRISDSIC